MVQLCLVKLCGHLSEHLMSHETVYVNVMKMLSVHVFRIQTCLLARWDAGMMVFLSVLGDA